MMQDAGTRARIAALGTQLGPANLAIVYDLYRAEQEKLAVAPTAADLAYGDHPRHRLDLYRPEGTDGPAPILVFVHGGGFLRGEKSSPDHPFSAHVGRWAARNGLLGVVINYRLAPENHFPAGGEDVGVVVDWLKQNAAQHGGEPERIVLAGTSAGAVNIATHLALRGPAGIAGAVMLSGLYGATPIEPQDSHYVKPEHLDRWSRLIDAVASADLPLFVACAEFDPPRFQAETLALLQRRLAEKGAMPRAYIASGHNHYSTAVHLGGSADTRLSDEILAFVAGCSGGQGETR